MTDTDEYAYHVVAEYPWEITVPYFEGPKMIIASTMGGDDVVIHIVHDEKVIAKTNAQQTSGTEARVFIGALAHAPLHYIATASKETALSSLSTFSTIAAPASLILGNGGAEDSFMSGITKPAKCSRWKNRRAEGYSISSHADLATELSPPMLEESR